MKPLNECRLYTFVDTAYLLGRKPADLARQLCDGGSDLIQLRAKNSTSDQMAEWIDQILPVTNKAGVRLVINDFYALALQKGAPAFHLGQEDFFDAGLTKVSELVSPGDPTLIGLSSHSPENARRAMAAGAHYLGVGPVFSTATKPEARPASLKYVEWAARNITVPWFAIGGINLSNLDQVLEAGARGICVVSAILKESDVAGACQSFKRRLV
jgi:thiamine-phosphate pyrophosphorylase